MIATTETRTVYVRGEAVQFSNQFDSIQAAVNVLKNSGSRSNFAADLIGAFNRDRISPKQIDWLLYLANEAVAPKKEIKGEYLPLVNQLYSAKGNGKRFMLRLPDGVTLSTVIQGNNAGAIYVKVGGEYAGKITKEGVLSINSMYAGRLVPILDDANEAGNLVKLAKAYGHETGSCSVCGRTLTDSLSVQMGIGPICAERFS